MIGRITGKLLEKKAPYVLVDVHGLGYELQVPLSTLERLGSVFETVSLHTHLIVREDVHLLFGFVREEERRLFRDLIKVNGVGPKLAMVILSSMEIKTFIKSILNDDLAYLIKLPGVGKKIAERLVIEMRDRFKDDWGDFIMASSLSLVPVGGHTQIKNEAMEALKILGYSAKEAERAVTKVNEELNVEQLVRRALQNLAMV